MPTKKKTTKTTKVKSLSCEDAFKFIRKYKKWYKEYGGVAVSSADSGGNPTPPPPPPPGGGG